MNYLAHIFLSGDNRKIRLGNFIGDAVKGKSFDNYPSEIRKGILLHRAIDSFTDSHPSVKATAKSMAPVFGRYSPALLDIYFDYILASRFERFSNVSLIRFSRSFYFTMIRERRYLPARIKKFMWHFIGTDRLGKYATKEGIKESLEIMHRVGRLKISPDQAIEYLIEHEQEIEKVFFDLFPELQAYSKEYIESTD